MVAEGDSVMVAAELPNDMNDATRDCGGARKKEAFSANEDVEYNSSGSGGTTLQGSLPKTSSEDSNTSETHQKDKNLKGFRKAPELQKFTLASFPTSKICVRRCELCGDCFTCFCRDLAIVSEETGPCCSWHAGWEKDSNSDIELDSFAEEYDDELETIAEEWTERLHKCHKFSTGNRRHKPRNNRLKRAVKEKQLRPKVILRGRTGHPLIMVIVKQDISARYAARKEQLADAFAAKKENIEKKLKALKLERRGPPKNCVVNTTATVNQAQQKQQSQQTQPVKYELREGDISQFTTSEDEAQLLTVLALIQHRDLLPEDYDLLLRLDENISKKTLGSNRLRSLRTKLLTDEDVKDIMHSDFAGATCAVCMECYHADEVVKWLPCEHVFHSNCIDTWLSEAGSICPLDGLEV